MYPRVLDIAGEYHIIRTIYTFGTLYACFAHRQDHMLVQQPGDSNKKKTGKKGGWDDNTPHGFSLERKLWENYVFSRVYCPCRCHTCTSTVNSSTCSTSSIADQDKTRRNTSEQRPNPNPNPKPKNTAEQQLLSYGEQLSIR